MYLNKDVFLDTETARTLYHEVAAELPIIDFHTHLPQQDIMDDHRFSDLWELWLKHDHYNGASCVAVVSMKNSSLEMPHRCLLYTSPSPRDQRGSRMPSSA